MYVFLRLARIDISVDNLITMHILIILRSSCLVYLGMFRLTNMRIAIIFARKGGEEDVENLGYLFLNMGIAMIFATKGRGGEEDVEN